MILIIIIKWVVRDRMVVMAEEVVLVGEEGDLVVEAVGDHPCHLEEDRVEEEEDHLVEEEAVIEGGSEVGEVVVEEDQDMVVRVVGVDTIRIIKAGE